MGRVWRCLKVCDYLFIFLSDWEFRRYSVRIVLLSFLFFVANKWEIISRLFEKLFIHVVVLYVFFFRQWKKRKCLGEEMRFSILLDNRRKGLRNFSGSSSQIIEQIRFDERRDICSIWWETWIHDAQFDGWITGSTSFREKRRDRELSKQNTRVYVCLGAIGKT